MKNLLLVLLATLSLAAHSASNPSWAIDVSGGQDHPLIHRVCRAWHESSRVQVPVPGL
ncbi:hypothetical protein [Rhodoferax sp.]|uniref:hypothetical protein n=1 Tax=Rhodoferax sp. TaxID=50421 RepID=UPI00284950B1|nr:hypothetical protein [Rhodoferax sp.]MDR3370252.1 hypothetical protein [Rhodoferax sp.]